MMRPLHTLLDNLAIQDASSSTGTGITLAKCAEAVGIETEHAETSDKKSNKKKQKLNKTDNVNKSGDIIICCPHCGIDIVIAKRSINCGIFRHGAFKHNSRPIKPHGSQAYCEDLVNNGKIYGCGNPFRVYIDKTSDVWTFSVEICDWI